jgi:hypothetical protein
MTGYKAGALDDRFLDIMMLTMKTKIATEVEGMSHGIHSAEGLRAVAQPEANRR